MELNGKLSYLLSGGAQTQSDSELALDTTGEESGFSTIFNELIDTVEGQSALLSLSDLTNALGEFDLSNNFAPGLQLTAEEAQDALDLTGDEAEQLSATAGIGLPQDPRSVDGFHPGTPITNELPPESLPQDQPVQQSLGLNGPALQNELVQANVRANEPTAAAYLQNANKALRVGPMETEMTARRPVLMPMGEAGATLAGGDESAELSDKFVGLAALAAGTKESGKAGRFEAASDGLPSGKWKAEAIEGQQVTQPSQFKTFLVDQLTPKASSTASFELLNVGQTENAKADVPSSSVHTLNATAGAGATRTSVEGATVSNTSLVQSLPERSPKWASDLGNNVKLMLNNRLQEAKIAVDPPELGPISVKITLQQNEVQVQFSAQHSQTRDALEYALPRLKDMLDASGFTLSDAGFSDRNSEESKADSDNSGSEQSSTSDNQGLNGENEETEVIESLPPWINERGVDFYA